MGHDRLDLAWLLLLCLAIGTLAASLLVPSRWGVDMLVLLLAAAKGRVIVIDYLGLRRAPGLWRGLLTAWPTSLVAFAGVAIALRDLI